jgi:hypothetical protein
MNRAAGLGPNQDERVAVAAVFRHFCAGVRAAVSPQEVSILAEWIRSLRCGEKETTMKRTGLILSAAAALLLAGCAYDDGYYGAGYGAGYGYGVYATPGYGQSYYGRVDGPRHGFHDRRHGRDRDHDGYRDGYRDGRR